MDERWAILRQAYLAEMSARCGSKSTAYGYRRMIEQFFGDRDPATVTGLEVSAWINRPTRYGRAPAPQTIMTRICPIRGMFRRAVDWGIIAADPTAKIKVPRPLPPPPRWLAPEHLERALAAIPAAVRSRSTRWAAQREARDRALFLLAAYTGLRRHELASLTAGTMQGGHMDANGGTWIVVRVKGGKQHKVRVPAHVRQAIEEAVVARVGQGIASLDPGANVWGTCSDDTVRQCFLRIGRELGMHLTPHMLRSTFAVLQATAGEPVPKIAGMLGHAHTATTDTYLRQMLSPSAPNEAAIDRALGLNPAKTGTG